MEKVSEYNIYKDISVRTKGDIYLGVVGPVRTGKSTFIKHFMDMLVIPNIENQYSKERAKDELPQSAAGKTIMTTEPKFVPNEAVDIVIDKNVSMKVRMIDCVGYIVDAANGYQDGDGARMVNTPWSDSPMPFAEAAEIGTKKVIKEHSTIGVLVTTDGTIADIARESYVDAEERVVKELKDINKPFIIVLNTQSPHAPETAELRERLETKHGAPVVAMNVMQMKNDDIDVIMEKLLYEFPLKEVKISYPKWIETLEITHWMKKEIICAVKEMIDGVSKLREVGERVNFLVESESVKRATIDKINLADGSVEIDMQMDETLFFKVLSETCGITIENEYQLISTIKKLAKTRKEYDKVAVALDEVARKGYGVVTPVPEEMHLETPEVVKHGARYGIRLKASAPSIHII